MNIYDKSKFNSFLTKLSHLHQNCKLFQIQRRIHCLGQQRGHHSGGHNVNRETVPLVAQHNPVNVLREDG